MHNIKDIDTIVVGGGLLGMLSARELALAGQRVVLLEQGSTGRESSWAGGGILSPLYPWRYDPAVTNLASWSQQHYLQLAHDLISEGCLDPEVTQSGLMILDNHEAIQARCWAVKNNIDLQELGTDRREHLAPEYDWRGVVEQTSLWMPQVAQVRNPRLAQSLRQSIEKHAVMVQENSCVSELIIHSQRVAGVQGNFDDLYAHNVVIAGGAWSQQFLPAGNYQMLVQPVKGQMVLFKAMPGVVQHIYLYKDRYLIPRRDGHVLMGSTIEDAGYDKTTTAEVNQELVGLACQMVPALRDYPVVKHWAGLRPGSPNGVPYITEHPEYKGLYFNAGHYRNGVVLGYASARLLADIMLQRPPIVDPADYGLSLQQSLKIDFV